MSSTMGTYSTVISGMRNSQLGLNTTGHNISNSDTKGYTRQQNIQTDYKYETIKNQKVGSLKQNTGLGSDVAEIRQIRNKFYDVKYRDSNSTANYYRSKADVGEEIEAIFGELETNYTVQEIFTDVWNCLNDLTAYPDGLDTRSDFIQTCGTFVTKVQIVSDELLKYQLNLNEQVKETVGKINKLIDTIYDCNEKIARYTAQGLNPNDYLDERNLALDELSAYIDIDVKSAPFDSVQILTEGNEILANGVCQHIGLKYASPDYPFVVPVFSESDEILGYGDDSARELYPTLDTDVLTVDSDKTAGKLKGLLISRGKSVANYTTDDELVSNYLIPKTQKFFDSLVNGVVSLLNDAVSPKTGELPADLNGNRTGLEIFVRSSGYERSKGEDPDDYKSLYTINNIELNPILVESTGYNFLCLSPSGDPSDTDLLNAISSAWKNGVEKLDNLSVDGYYSQFITAIGVEVEEAKNQADANESTAEVTDNQRMIISGVSLDEELTSMLKYQYAYQAAAKMLSVIDSMVNKIVNEMV